ncbi:MAG: hypothetical protein M0R02_16600 [Bacteroidales bacterium]|nr:hypothetical protein [Bacteroidales bacterium]
MEVIEKMLSESVSQRLAALHPDTGAELLRINRLAREAADPALLELCTELIDALLQDRSPALPQALTPREKAFLAFTEQFATSVSTLSDEQVSELLRFASEDEVYSFVNALYVIDMTRRLDLVAGRLLT